MSTIPTFYTADAIDDTRYMGDEFDMKARFWAHFAQRVPLGTHVKGACNMICHSGVAIPISFQIKDEVGIVMGHKETPVFYMEYNEALIYHPVIVQFFNGVSVRDMKPTNLLYHIDGQWLTFNQVMFLEAQ